MVAFKNYSDKFTSYESFSDTNKINNAIFIHYFLN